MSRVKGNQAEDMACVFLISKGFEVLERNFFARFGEIDIIASKSGVLHFVEVKSGVGFEPVYNITPSKLKKLTQAINYYLLSRNISQPYCLDALIIKRPRDMADKNELDSEMEAIQFELIENITLC